MGRIIPERPPTFCELLRVCSQASLGKAVFLRQIFRASGGRPMPRSYSLVVRLKLLRMGSGGGGVSLLILC